MTWLAAIAIAVVCLAGFGVIYARRARRRRDRPPVLAADLAARVTAAARAFAGAEPWHPSADNAPEGAVAVEAALIANDPKRALEAAETMVAAAPGHDLPRHWLAWALVANGQPAAAIGALDDRVELAILHVGGPYRLGRYVRARAEHLAFEHGAGAIGALPPLVTTADLAVMTLARGRGSAAWLQGAQEVQLSAEQVRAAVAEHREVTARCLGDALAALADLPGFADAAYLVARLAIKAGALGPARAMFDAVAPRIAGRPDAESFARDLRDLDDPEAAVAAAKQAPVPESAKRSRSLRVL